MSNKQKKKRTFSLRKLIYNDKYLIIISIFAAVIIWVATSMNLSPEGTNTISVPLSIDFSGTVTEEWGIECYGDENVTVDVTITAKKYLMKDITSDDIVAKLQTNSVSTTGVHEIPIIVTANSSDFMIKSYYPTTYKAYFDFPEEQEMEVQLSFKDENYVADGYIAGEPIISTPSLTVSGPKAYIAKVNKISANVVFDKPLTETTTVDVTPSAVDMYGSEVNYVEFQQMPEQLTVTIPIYKLTELPVHATLINVPPKANTSAVKVSYSKDKVKVGILENAEIKTAELGEISYSKLGVGDNKFTFSLVDMDGIVPVDKSETVTVTVSVPKTYEDKTIRISSSAIALNNVPDGYTARIKSIEKNSVTVVGPPDVIEEMRGKDLSLSCDLSTEKGKEVATGEKEYPISISIKDSNGAWIYGTYKATVVISKK